MADDLCFSSSTTCPLKNLPNFHLISTTLLHDFTLLCSFILSHPLYFSYFLFFSPYFIKFISFVSPLFFTTAFLLLLSLLTTTTAFSSQFLQPKLGFIQFIIDKLRSEIRDAGEEDELCNFEDFEIYKIVFDDTSLIPICYEEEGEDDKLKEERKVSEEVVETAKIPENSVDKKLGLQCTITKADKTEDEKSLENLFEELDRFEDSTTILMKETEETSENSNKFVDELRKEDPVLLKNRSDAEVKNERSNNKTVQNSVNCEKLNSWRSDSSSSLWSTGSMRKEKEWKRTLACKLFEERHNAGGGEDGMDSLWEAHENDNSKNTKEITINKNKMMMKNKIKTEMKFSDHDHGDGDEDDEEDLSNGQLCCLQALNFSAGKMNLGMGRPNLVKITKALKGFGWLHHASSKHGKKR